jgi:hypothetical protein
LVRLQRPRTGGFDSGNAGLVLDGQMLLRSFRQLALREVIKRDVIVVESDEADRWYID